MQGYTREGTGGERRGMERGGLWSNVKCSFTSSVSFWIGKEGGREEEEEDNKGEGR